MCRRATRATLALLLAALVPRAHAAQPQPLPAPNLDFRTPGAIKCLVRLPDGSVIAGGRFNSVYDPGSQLNLARTHLAKFTAAGVLDFTFNPVLAADDEIYALAIDGAGTIYVGGSFTAINGVPRNHLAKLTTTDAFVDPNWNPAPNGLVDTLAVDASGMVLVGGFFTSVGGQVRNNLARLSPGGTGAAQATWNPAPDSEVYRVAIGAGGEVYVGGTFANIAGAARGGLARLIPASGAIDTGWTPVGNFRAQEIVSDASHVYVGTEFGDLRRLDRTSGMIDAGWSAPFGGFADLALDSSYVYAAGPFQFVGGLERNSLVRFAKTGTGSPDPVWNPAPDGGGAALALAPDGTLYFGGAFNTIAGALQMGFAHLDATGANLPTAFVQDAPRVGYDPYGSHLARGPDGSIYVAGNFGRAGLVARNGLLRLLPDGTLDAQWNPVPDGAITGLAVDANGRLVVSGAFKRIGGLARRYLARLDGGGTGAADALWNPDPDGVVTAVAFAPNGALYVGGAFGSIGGGTNAGFARLDTNGVIDPTFAPAPNGAINGIAFDDFGTIFVIGNFNMIGGQAHQGAARIDPAVGAVDSNFEPAPDIQPSAIAIRSTGLYMAGAFIDIGGARRPGVARLSPATGAADLGWDARLPQGVFIGGIAFDPTPPDPKVYIGGEFATINFEPHPNLARLQEFDGHLDTTWQPDPNGPATSLLLAGDRMYVAGEFREIGGVGRRSLAALPLVVDALFKDGFE